MFVTPDGPLDIDAASMGLAACTWGFYVSLVSPTYNKLSSARLAAPA